MRKNTQASESLKKISEAEKFLKRFHNEKPGLTPLSIGRGKTQDGRSSYECLISAVFQSPVLDIGCGDGYLLEKFASRLNRIQLYGIDLSQGEIERARQRRTLIESQVIVGNARKLPYLDHAFGAVVSHMALMLVPSVDVVLEEVKRVLRSDGEFVFVVGNLKLIPSKFTEAYLACIRDVQPLGERSSVSCLSDERFTSPQTMTELLERAGFCDIKSVSHEMSFASGLPEIQKHFLSYYPSQAVRNDPKFVDTLITRFRHLISEGEEHREGFWLVSARKR